jgi:hypothetical protein
MSTYSTNLKLELITTGQQAGTWGDTTNTNVGTLLEQAISGYVTQSVATGTDTTITIPNGASGVARNMFIELTGTGGASTNLIVPANKKLYFIYNNASGAVTVKVTGLIGVSVPANAKMILVSDGTDIVNATNYVSSLTLGAALAVTSGGTGVTTSTGSGANVLATSPTLVTPILGTPTSGNLANCTFPTLNQNTTGTAAGLSATLAVASGGTGVTTSTGSGANVLSTSPTLVTPVLGTPQSGNLANCTFPTLNQNTTGNADTATTATNATNILASTSQSYTNVTSSRSINTTYTNSTSKPIFISIGWSNNGGGATASLYVNGNIAAYTLQDLYPRPNLYGCVPAGQTYYATWANVGGPAYWLELR